MELLERDILLDELGRLWNEARQGRGRFVFLGGEAGVGKTSVVRAFDDRIAGSRRPLIGWCDPLSTPRPLGPLIDMVAGTGGELERLVEAGAGRDRLLPGVLTDLHHGPALMVVEDAHWADEATLDLLRYLGRRVGTAPALIVVTYRDDEIGKDHPLQRVMGDLATAEAVHRLRIVPLSESAVRRLAGDRISDPGDLYRKTGGNPFYVTEILSAGGEGVPGTVRDAVMARVGRLSSSARDVLATAAVIGSVIEPWLLAETSGDAEAVDECIAAGVLRMAEEGAYAFRHELARETMYEAIPTERRRAFHRSVLHALQSLPDQNRYLSRLAHHAEEAGEGALVLSYAPAAAAWARAHHSHREAAAQYRRALRFSSELPATERARLHEELSAECMTISNLGEGIEARNAAIAIWRDQGDRLKEAENAAQKASLLVLNGQNADGEAAIELAMVMIRGLPEDRLHGHIYRINSQIRMLNRDTREAIIWGERAIVVAERFGDVEVVIGAENAVGSAMLVAGDIEKGRTWLERSRARAIEAGMGSYAAVALNNLGSGAGEVHQFRMARDYLQQSIAYGTEYDLDASRWYGTSWLALCELHLGNWPAAGELATSILKQPNAPTIGRIMALLALGRLRARRGDPDVWEALDEALALSAPTGTLQRLGPVHAARAEAAWLAGDRDRSAGEARAAYDLALDHHHAWFVGELAYWQWKTGVLISPPEEAAPPYHYQMTGDWEAAAAAWEELGCPYEAARARAESGLEEELRKALRTFERLDARPAAAITIKSLRDLGARRIPRGPRPTTLANPANLTTRETEVLRLLISGRRNSEIANALFLSPKTVEHHVSAILGKLGVRTRSEAVEAARSLEL